MIYKCELPVPRRKYNLTGGSGWDIDTLLHLYLVELPPVMS